MISIKLLTLLLVFGLCLSQRLSLWKRYVHNAGALNCVEDGVSIQRSTSKFYTRYCVARIANESGIYPGHLFTTRNFTSYSFFGEVNGTWFEQKNLGQVEVLDVEPSLKSWIPIAFKPSESVLIEPEAPYSSNPKRFICRSPTHIMRDTVVQVTGVMKDGVCYTEGWQYKYDTGFEVLSLNERARMFYDFGYTMSGSIS